MKMYVTIKVDYFNDPDGPRIEKYAVDHPWNDKMFCKCGFRRDDFDWCQCSKKNCFFGRSIEDRAITAFVVVVK